jgi:hypothetical protein
MLRGERRVVDAERTLGVVAAQGVGDRRHDPTRSALVVRTREFGEAERLAYQQPAQRGRCARRARCGAKRTPVSRSSPATSLPLPTFAAVGRMALSAYLPQSLVALVAFAGFGLNDRLESAQALLVLATIWAALLAACPASRRCRRTTGLPSSSARQVPSPVP